MSGFASHIRMVTPRQAAMGLRDRLVIGVARDPQDDIGVALDPFEHL